jgi:hypothetical protein
MHATAEFIRDQSKQPAGTLAATDLSDEVKAELQAENVSIGSFLQLVPLLLELFRNEQLRELVTKILAALKPQQ